MKTPAIVGSSTFSFANVGGNVSNMSPVALDKDFVLNIPFTDKDTGARMHKAFQHAITLCGGGKPVEAEPI